MSKEKVYVIWDNSNIHYGGLNHVFPGMEPGVPRTHYRTNFTALLNLVQADRELATVYFVGSTPPESDNIWSYLDSIGVHTETIPRAVSGGEWQTTDHLLQNHLLRLGYRPEKGTIALLSGDGAGIKKDEGFFADLKRLASMDWKVEVYSWDETCHTGLKKYAEENWKFVNLSDHYFEITFLTEESPSLDEIIAEAESRKGTASSKKAVDDTGPVRERVL